MAPPVLAATTSSQQQQQPPPPPVKNLAHVFPNNNSQPKKPTYMARLILRMQESLEKLGVDTEESDFVLRRLEDMAILIHESMCVSSRNYHSVQHVFDISRNMTDPITTLAALFHDCVYYHVDGGFSARQAERLKGSIVVQEKDCLVEHVAQEDTLLRMVISIFGFEAGQSLNPFTGINEFLSAIVAVRELDDLLTRPQLAEIAACIEATIPFRPVSKDGKTPLDRLHDNLIRTNTQFELGMTDQQMIETVQRATLVVHADLENFGTEDRSWFLENTWSLLPESNEALRHQYLYRARDFQFAIFKMHGFFSFLKSEVVFRQFQGVPDDATFARRCNNAARNIEIGRRYVAAKLLSISVLAAVAELTGGDAPLSMFMGDLPSRNRVSIRLGDVLPSADAVKALPGIVCDEEVFELLTKGRRAESAFDIKQSPLAAYLYSTLGDAGVEAVLKDMKLYPMDRNKATQLLKRLPKQAIQTIAKSLAIVARSRAEMIHQVLENVMDDEGAYRFFI